MLFVSDKQHGELACKAHNNMAQQYRKLRLSLH